MRSKIVIASLLAAATSAAFAQSVQRSSSPSGVQIQGDTAINASAQNTSSLASGEGNTAKTATGALRAGTQIQGNTRINATSTNVQSTAVGKNNAAVNDVGSIGGK